MTNFLTKIIISIFVTCSIISFITSIILICIVKENKNMITTEQKIYEELQTEDSDWEIFKKALIQVESQGNINAENKITKAFGLYQMLPKGGYLDEYNRLTGSKVSIKELKDNPILQEHIFETIQQYKNPEHDLRKALFIHNPKAMNKDSMSFYEYKVMYNYYKLKAK